MIFEKKSKMFLFIFIVFIFVLMVVDAIYVKKQNHISDEVIYESGGNVLGVLSNDDIIIQEFDVQKANEIVLGICCGTYFNTDNNNGVLHLVCENANGDLIKSEEIDIHSIQDNSYIFLSLDGNLVDDNFIVLKIIPEQMTPETMLTLYTTNYDDADYNMMLNGELQDKEIALVAEYKNGLNYYKYSIMYGIALLLFIQCIFYLVFILIKNKQYNLVFCMLSYVLLGILTVVWIVIFNDGYYMIENCLTKVGIVFVCSLITYYLYVKHVILSIYKKILIVCGAIICTGFIGTVGFVILYRNNVLTSFSKIYIAFFIGILLIIEMIILFCLKIIRDDLLFAAVVFFVGSIYALSYPFSNGVSWDDQIHYERSLLISHLSDEQISTADLMLYYSAYGGSGPQKIIDGTIDDFKTQVIEAYNSHEMVDYPKVELTPGVILSYLPSATALFVGRGIGLPYQYTFILGRWVNVAFYSVILLLALKRIKSGKILFFAVSMFPTTLFLMSNYAYDTWGIGIPLLAFAYYIGIMQDSDKKIRYCDLIIICTLFLIGYSAKPIYFCMVLFLLAVKNEKIGNIPRFIYNGIVILTACIIAASFMLPFLIGGDGGDDWRGGEAVNSSDQVHFIISSPLKYTAILIRFLWGYWSLKNAYAYVDSMAYLGNVSFFVPYFVFVVFLVIMDKEKEDAGTISIWSRIWTILLSFITSAWVATALYVSFTPVGYWTINGVQQRYLIPFIYFIGYYISDYRLVRFFKRFLNQRILSIVSSVVLSIYAIYAIYSKCIILY